jgi:fructose-bisphosphate aldolase class II
MPDLREVLQQTQQRGVAIGHFNISDLVLLKAVVAQGERDFMGVHEIAALVKSLREESGVPIFLNADHTHSLAKAEEAAKAGFDAVVFDLSALPLEENVRQTKEAVASLKSIHPSILIEGEIGDIGTGSEIHETTIDVSKGLTTPEEAKQFVVATGIDILAPAVGNMHGMSGSMVRGETRKHLDIKRIAEIKKATGMPLTLHGGSGTDDEDFRKAIAAGINIVHINTELRVAWRESLEASLAKKPGEVVPYKILPPVIEAVKEVALSRLRLFNGERLAA